MADFDGLSADRRVVVRDSATHLLRRRACQENPYASLPSLTLARSRASPTARGPSVSELVRHREHGLQTSSLWSESLDRVTRSTATRADPMRTYASVLTTIAILIATPARGQTLAMADTTTAKRTPVATTDSATTKKAEGPSNVQSIEISRLRAVDQRGINVYEAPKNDCVPYTGFKLGWGAAFTQQFQGLGHYSTATPVIRNGVNANQLQRVGHGFNNAVANLYLNAQLAKGIRVSMSSYLSSRHHQETWVKDGYLQIDDSPIDHALLNKLMQYVTIKAGHMEINYGDEHFRRTDNGNAMYNPFVGNLLMDAFTTEIGGEVYLRNGPWMLMGGVT